MIEQVAFAVSTSEEKYVLNGVLLEIGKTKVSGDNSNVRLIATDGYRLAKRGHKVAGVTGESAVIVPGKALNELLRMIDGEAKGEVKVQITQEQISFKYEEVYLVSRLIHGQFPDYKQVIPKSAETKITINTKALLEASERTAVIASSNANIIRMELKEGKLHLIASAPEVGNADEIVEVEVKGSDKAQVAFNVRLLVDALKVIEEEKVQLDVSGPLSPGVIKPIDGQDYLYIVMPIRTQDAAM